MAKDISRIRSINEPDSIPRAKTKGWTNNKVIRELLSRKLVILGLIVLAALFTTAIFAPFLAPYDPYKQNLTIVLQQPSMEHLLGTDHLGRDILSRLIYGSRASLAVGFCSVLIASSVGMTLGMIAGYFGGIIDTLIMRTMDAKMAIPSIILALALGSALGGGLGVVIFLLGIAIIPTYTRLMRGQVLTVRNSDYVVAGEISGASDIRNMLIHVLPNCISPIIVLITLNLGTAILAEAGLSFLGLGIKPPGAAWGAMVNDGYSNLVSNPILSFAPGLCIMIVVLAFNIVGDALRDALDPRYRGLK